MVGRMMSLFTLGSLGTTPLGGLIIGSAIDNFSPRVAVGLGATSAILIGLLLAVRMPAQGEAAVLTSSPTSPSAKS